MPPYRIEPLAKEDADRYVRDLESFRFFAQAQTIAGHRAVNFISETVVNLSTWAVLSIWFSWQSLGLWFLFAVCCSAFSWWCRNDFQPFKASFNRQRWLSRSELASFLVAFSWGIVPLMFFTQSSLNYLVFIVCVYAGYTAGALSVNVANPRAFIAFLLGIGTPLCIQFFSQGQLAFTILGGQVVLFAGLLLYVLINVHKLFLQSTQSNYENTLLTQQLAQEKAAVEDAVKAKDRFLAAASHDLRQPLNAVNLFVDALRPLQANEQGTAILDKIRKSLTALTGMLHALLDISKLDAEALDINPSPVSLSTMVAQLLEEYQPKAPHIRIDNQVATEVTVLADATLLYRIVRNLLDNAVKYTQEGAVVIACEHTVDSVCLTIKDTGIGIPPEKLESVFHEFEQVDNHNRNRELGLGLGLSIVRRLCDLSGFTLKLDSILHVGTTVSLTVPLSNDKVAISSSESSMISLNGLNVVVIDDEEDILLATQQVLSNWGCKVVCADSYSIVLRQLRAADMLPDLILSDLRLGEQYNGVDAIELIREEYNTDVPAILITGDTSPERIRLAKNCDAELLYKPINVEELWQAIETAVSRP